MPSDETHQLSMLPLFDNAQILWFPVRRRRHVARGVARRLLAADGRLEQVQLWKHERAKLAAEMRSHALDESQIGAELQRFFDVVGFEAWRIRHVPAAQNADGLRSGIAGAGGKILVAYGSPNLPGSKEGAA